MAIAHPFRGHASDSASTRTAAATRTPPAQGHPGAYFAYDLVVILLLAYLAAGNAASASWRLWPFVWPSFSFERVIPLWVPWAGALGGATISLVGVVRYAHRWDPAVYRWWHLSRPLLGAVSGTFAVLIIVFVLDSVAPDADQSGFTAKGTAVLTAIAFVVGYREETFRELVKRVADLVLKPEPKQSGAGVVAFVPVEADFGTVAVGASATCVVRLHNGTNAPVLVSTQNIAPRVAGLALAGSDTNLQPDQFWPLTLTWTPAAAGALDQPLALTAGGRVFALPVRGTAS